MRFFALTSVSDLQDELRKEAADASDFAKNGYKLFPEVVIEEGIEERIEAGRAHPDGMAN